MKGDFSDPFLSNVLLILDIFGSIHDAVLFVCVSPQESWLSYYISLACCRSFSSFARYYIAQDKVLHEEVLQEFALVTR